MNIADPKDFDVNEGGFKAPGFWHRIAAYTIDAHLFTTIYVLGICAILASNNSPESNLTAINNLGNIGLLMWVLYFTIAECTKGYTFGKYCAGLKVEDDKGEKLSFIHALGRFLAAFLNYITLCIGYVMVGLTKNKRGLHDIVSNTRIRQVQKSRASKWVIITLIGMLLAIIALGVGFADELHQMVEKQINEIRQIMEGQ